MIRLLFILILVAGSLSLQAQLLKNPEKTIQRNTLRAERFEAGALLISPFIIPAYSPELGITLNAGGLLTFKTKRNNPDF